MKRIIAALLAAGAMSVVVLPAGASAKPASRSNILQLIEATPRLSTLARLVKSSPLIFPAFVGKGPLTLFAPTNAAFAKLPSSELKSLAEPQNQGELIQLLEYQVVKGHYTSAKIERLTSLTTFEGSKLSLSLDGGNIFVNTAEIVKPNIAASNGVIHEINGVLIPKN